MGLFSDLFHPGRPYKEASNVSHKYYDEAQGGLKPYNENGQKAGQSLFEQLQNYLNPVDLQNKWEESYKTSPYAQHMLERNKDYQLSAANQMGLSGSSSALNNIANTGNDIMNKDRQQYMDDLMKKYMAGTGLGESIYGTGATTAGQMGANAMHQGETEAGYKYGEKSAGPEMIGNLGKGALQMLMAYLTGGMGSGGMGRGMFTPDSGFSGGAY